MTTELTHIKNESTGESNLLVSSLNSQAKSLIDEFEKNLRVRLLDKKFQPYTSIDDILESKFHIKDLEKVKEPDYSNKTEFITAGVRGNTQKANGNVLSYDEAEEIIMDAEEEDLP